RQEKRCLLAEDLRHPPLQLVDRRILAHLFVAELGRDHRREHLARRLRRGVGTEVDHASESSGSSPDCRRANRLPHCADANSTNCSGASPNGSSSKRASDSSMIPIASGSNSFIRASTTSHTACS